MALVFMDGFDANDFSTKGYVSITGSQGVSSTTRYNSGLALKLGTDSFGNWGSANRKFTAVNQIFMGLAVYNLTPGKAIINLFGDNGTTQHLSLQTNANSQLIVVCGSTTIATSSSPYNWAIWHYVEISATISSTAGTVAVRVDGAMALSYTGNTKNGGTNNSIDMMEFGINNGNNALFDDMYVLDGTGTTNNNFLGEITIQALFPTAAGSTTQLSPTGTANNWDNVNDIPPNTNTYNAGSTTGYRDTYGMGDLPSTAVNVLAMQTTTMMKKLDAGTGMMKPALVAGASLYYGATQALSGSVVSYFDKFETNPATGSAWTQADINALELGAEIA